MRQVCLTPVCCPFTHLYILSPSHGQSDNAGAKPLCRHLLNCLNAPAAIADEKTRSDRRNPNKEFGVLAERWKHKGIPKHRQGIANQVMKRGLLLAAGINTLSHYKAPQTTQQMEPYTLTQHQHPCGPLARPRIRFYTIHTRSSGHACTWWTRYAKAVGFAWLHPNQGVHGSAKRRLT